jgi:hypothetical protein
MLGNYLKQAKTPSFPLLSLMMEAVRTSKTSVYSNEATWRYTPEDSELHTFLREKMKSHIIKSCSSSEGLSTYKASWSHVDW